MNERDRETALRTRALLERGAADATALRAALAGVAPLDRDGWVDEAFGLEPPPDDGPDLPLGCVPYLPCPVDALLRMIDLAAIDASDCLIDVGSGVGRAAALIRLLTGATVVGVEVQRALVDAARELSARLHFDRISFVAGDAARLPEPARAGTVFFLYCPFSGERLARLLAELQSLARTRTIRVCCVDLPLPACDWLTPIAPLAGDLAIYRSATIREHRS